MKRFLAFFILLIYSTTVFASEEQTPDKLYAKSAVLMDAESGRILFDKNGSECLAMASTTKIMTCILALEQGDLDAIVTVSKEAEKQPKVHLGMLVGEQFVLKDLLYSLMLESHNDSAVAIAEHISGSTEEFVKTMNQKAKEIGCTNTHFVTPNGLDGSDKDGEHRTTAEELALIMQYCIKKSPKKKEFLSITQTPNHTFSNIKGNRTFQCYNRNSLLTMMEGVISGKTGYTGKAGYCYVGALKRDDRTFIVALLACGWPNNKNYKWKDARNIFEYAIDNYQYKNVYNVEDLPKVLVKDGVSTIDSMFGEKYLKLKLEQQEDKKIKVLLNQKEKVEIQKEIPNFVNAPIKKGEKVGKIVYLVNQEVIAERTLVAVESVERKTLSWCFLQIAKIYFKV